MLAFIWLAIKGQFNFKGRINKENYRYFNNYCKSKFICNICGNFSKPYFNFPDLNLRRSHKIKDIRETLECTKCGSTLRHRALIFELLKLISKKSKRQINCVKDIKEADLRDIKILDTDAFSPAALILKKFRNYVVTSFIPRLPLNIEISQNYFNMDLEKIGFEQSTFDIILTSDVMEHVRNVNLAHSEIARILKSGGSYIFTIPYDEYCDTHDILVDTSSENNIYIVPPQFHGDPLTGGILAYRVFGNQIFEDLEFLQLKTEFYKINSQTNLIVNGDVFNATKIYSK